jgi:hypothetical protein
MYECRTYVELPVISSIRYSYGNSGFGYHDALHYGSGSNSDSLIIDFDNLEKKLKKRNYLRNEVSVNLAGAGFRFLGDYYAHFNISVTTENRNGYPGDLVSMKDGNWDPDAGQPRDLNLSGFGVNGTSYIQFAAGISTEIMTGLYVGATVKYLKGAANITTQKSDLLIETQGNPIAIRANTDYKVRTSFPMSVSYDPEGYVESIDFSNSFSNTVGDYLLNKNHGGAIDLGVIYEYDEQITLAASLIDLGAIRWGSNTNQFNANASVDFMGFDLRNYATSGSSTDFLEAFLDSIAEAFQFETNQKPYWSGLVPKLYAGASYQVYPALKVSALTRTEFFDRRPHFSLTLAGMYSPLPYVHGMVSYSVMNYKFDQLGFGLVLGGKGAQLYIVTDHIPVRWVRDTGSGLIWPYNARTMNIRFGVNLLFECDDRDKGKFGKYGQGGRSRKPGSKSKGKYCPAYD